MTTTTSGYFTNSFSEEIWALTYRHHSDKNISDTWRRVAKAIASVEIPELQKEWEDKFYDMLEGFKVVPGGRILANAGTGWKNTGLTNCFVAFRPKAPLDSIDGIVELLHKFTTTLKSEGGIGIDLNIRPRSAFIEGIGVESPGSVKFLELFDKASEIITAGSGMEKSNKKAKGKIRKGACMAVMSCFAENVEILTNKGLQTILQICIEKDPNLKAITENGEEYPIINWIINPPNQLYEVEDEDGNKIKVTADHEFMVYNIETKEEYLKPLCKINPNIEMLVRFE